MHRKKPFLRSLEDPVDTPAATPEVTKRASQASWFNPATVHENMATVFAHPVTQGTGMTQLRLRMKICKPQRNSRLRRRRPIKRKYSSHEKTIKDLSKPHSVGCLFHGKLFWGGQVLVDQWIIFAEGKPPHTRWRLLQNQLHLQQVARTRC